MTGRSSWLVLAYRVPGEPSRLRSAVWRRLRAAGAVYLAHSVAALPASPRAERLLDRLRADIGGMGGSAQLLRAEALAGEADIVGLFNAARDAEYALIIEGCRDLCGDIEALMAAGQHTADDLERGGRRLAKLAGRNDNARDQDPFGASRAESAAAALARCREALGRFAEHVYQEAEARPAAREHH
jgi:hypothetical protein